MIVVEVDGAVLEDFVVTVTDSTTGASAGPTDAVTVGGLGLAILHDLSGTVSTITAPDPTLVFVAGIGGERRALAYRYLSIDDTMSMTVKDLGGPNTLICTVVSLVPSAPLPQTWTGSPGAVTVTGTSGAWSVSRAADLDGFSGFSVHYRYVGHVVRGGR